MTLYLSDYKRYPKTMVATQATGLTTLDSFNVEFTTVPSYRTVKYKFTAEDAFTDSIYTCSFTVTHDSLHAYVSEYDVTFGGDLDLTVNADYTNVVGGYPTTIDVTLNFPPNFDGSWSLEKEVFINIKEIQKTGTNGPSAGMYPSQFLYPSS